MNFIDGLHAAGDFWHKGYKLKEYVIKDGKQHPFALICPGGGYGMVCSFLEGEPYAKELNRRGYSAFVLYYHCKKAAHYPAPQQDVARALSDIISRAKELNVSVADYSLWGSSAGGHLAASFGTTSMGYAKYNLPRPKALVLCYPVITMGELTHEGSRLNLLGMEPTEEQVVSASVEKQITTEYPPTFVWCGTADRTVPPANSHMLVDELKANNVPYVFKEYTGVDHGVGLGKGLACELWFEEAVSFWKKQMQS